MQGYFFPCLALLGTACYCVFAIPAWHLGQTHTRSPCKVQDFFFFLPLDACNASGFMCSAVQGWGNELNLTWLNWDNWGLSQSCSTPSLQGVDGASSIVSGLPSCSPPGCWEAAATPASPSRAGAACLSPASPSPVFPHQAPKTCAGTLPQSCSHACPSEGAAGGSDPPCSRS